MVSEEGWSWLPLRAYLACSFLDSCQQTQIEGLTCKPQFPNIYLSHYTLLLQHLQCLNRYCFSLKVDLNLAKTPLSMTSSHFWSQVFSLMFFTLLPRMYILRGSEHDLISAALASSQNSSLFIDWWYCSLFINLMLSIVKGLGWKLLKWLALPKNRFSPGTESFV